MNLPRFLDLAEEAVANFAGLKYTSGDLEVGVACLKVNRRVFLGNDALLGPALVMGFDSVIMTVLNICPELVSDILRSVDKKRISMATDNQRQLTRRVGQIRITGDRLSDMKAEFNRICPELSMGATRKPL